MGESHGERWDKNTALKGLNNGLICPAWKITGIFVRFASNNCFG